MLERAASLHRPQVLPCARSFSTTSNLPEAEFNGFQAACGLLLARRHHATVAFLLPPWLACACAWTGSRKSCFRTSQALGEKNECLPWGPRFLF